MDKYLFTKSNFLDELLCPICKCIMKNPMGLPCKDGSHSFCKECVTPWIDKNNYCPVCAKQPPSKLFIDIISKNIINLLKRKCDHYEDGCKWIGTVENHQKHLDYCKYHVVPCKMGCTHKCKRIDMKDHIKDCEYRWIHCHKCMKKIRYNELNDHLDDVCNNVIISCPHCSISDKRIKILKHQSKCNEMMIKCKYYDIGCEHECKLKELFVHYKKNMRKHFKLLENIMNNREMAQRKEIVFSHDDILQNVHSWEPPDEIQSTYLWYKAKPVEIEFEPNDGVETTIMGMKMMIDIRRFIHMNYSKYYIVFIPMNEEFHFNADISIYDHDKEEYYQLKTHKGPIEACFDGETYIFKITTTNNQDGFEIFNDVYEQTNYIKDGMMKIKLENFRIYK